MLAESLGVGASLDGFQVVIASIERIAPADLSAQQRNAGMPSTWTLIRFEVPDADAQRLANAWAEIVEPGWYVDFHTSTETFVVFAERFFRYTTSEPMGRAEAVAYGRGQCIPESQLDWP
jgi:hypothetical protein